MGSVVFVFGGTPDWLRVHHSKNFTTVTILAPGLQDNVGKLRAKILFIFSYLFWAPYLETLLA
jgi:hypothetical protein